MFSMELRDPPDDAGEKLMDGIVAIKFLMRLVPAEEPAKDAMTEETAKKAIRGLMDLYTDHCVMVPEYSPEEENG